MKKNKSFLLIISIAALITFSSYIYWKKIIDSKSHQTSILLKSDELIGSGNEVLSNSNIEFNYQAFIIKSLDDERFDNKFDSSYDRKQTMKIKLGNSQFYGLIESALIGMKEGGIRIVKVKASDLFKNESFNSKSINFNENSILAYKLEVSKVF